MKTAIALVVRDEQDAIIENLVYHIQVQGFTRALVYSNSSTDATDDRVRALSRTLPVELIEWPDQDGIPRAQNQMAAYMDAAKRVVGDVQWLACLDADEMLHSVSGRTIEHLLAPQPFDVSQVSLNWATFGSSGHVKAPIGTMIESYTWRRLLNHPVNRHCKSIVRPERMLSAGNPHAFQVHGRTVNGIGEDIAWGVNHGITAGNPPLSNWRCNHYLLRSRDHWERRLRRGQFNAIRTEQQWEELDRGDEQDRSAPIFYGARLHAALAAVTTESIDALPPMARVEGTV